MPNFNSKITKIEARFAKNTLPGLTAQLKLAPLSRRTELMTLKGKNAKKSAVLILFYPKDDRVHIVMMLRATDNSVHSGQVSFPGGMMEESDESLIYTALREANEEIGIVPESVRIIGQLTKLYIPPSNFDVYPFVGVTDSTPIFKTNYEVQKILEIDLDTLLAPETLTYKNIQLRTGNEFEVPCYYIQGMVLWGASAMIMAEMLEVVKSDS